MKTFSDGSSGGGVTHKTRPVRHEERREAVRIEKFRWDGFVEWLARFASYAVNYTV